MTPRSEKYRVGDLRPNQLLLSFGIGSIIELPNMSAMVMGLDDWEQRRCQEINEPRLLKAVRQGLGSRGRRVDRLLAPPHVEDSEGRSAGPFDESSQIGVPVAPFPRWLLCPSCRLLAPIASQLFQLQPDPYRPDRTRFVHVNCTNGQTRNPTAVPARFLVCCSSGHLDDFPWIEFVHQGDPCGAPRLRLFERSVSADAVGVMVQCVNCERQRTMAQAFGESGERNLPLCRGRQAHLREFEEACSQPLSSLLLGASNSWFPVSLSALSLPQGGDEFENLIDQNWAVLGKAESQQNIELLISVGQLREFANYSAEEIWTAIERRRQEVDDKSEGEDLRSPEWEVFSNPTGAPITSHFKLTEVEPPVSYRHVLERVVLVERLREVRALIGFTRIDAPGEDGGSGSIVQISRNDPTWVPAAEVRGEGLFLQFKEDRVSDWEGRVANLNGRFLEAHRAWRNRHALDPDGSYPGLRYVLIHSFAHALLRQLGLECGYATASIRERIYCRDSLSGESPMAGVLLYTAAPDSEGTLGGLVSLGKADQLGRHLDQTLEGLLLCPSDPLCAEKRPSAGDLSLSGSACHACLFASETSCERGNRYLDRSVLVETLESRGLAFFGQ